MMLKIWKITNKQTYSTYFLQETFNREIGIRGAVSKNNQFCVIIVEEWKLYCRYSSHYHRMHAYFFEDLFKVGKKD
jgi:aspartate 1-decarboxylase